MPMMPHANTNCPVVAVTCSKYAYLHPNYFFARAKKTRIVGLLVSDLAYWRWSVPSRSASYATDGLTKVWRSVSQQEARFNDIEI